MFSLFKKKPTSSKKIRLRFPPSPTGPLHIGNARTILFNYLFAKQQGGETVLRIEDTDKERSKLEWVQNIIDELHWLGLTWDEGPDIGGNYGPYKQSQRLDIYEKYLRQLLTEKKAYYCDCTPEELEAKRQDQQARGVAPKYDGKCRDKNKTSGVIRFKVANKKVSFTDVIRGKVEFDMGLLGDIVIAKDLQTPLYHFAVVIDDQEMQISHIIRGEDHLSNTPKQILIQEALGFYHPTYAHVPLMLNADKSKMSKRAGDVAVSDYHKNGYLPEALINFMALLGWNPGTEKEIFSLEQLVKEFSLEKVQKSSAIFNVQKLDSINGHYIREKSAKTLAKLCLPYLKEAGLLSDQFSEQYIEKVVEVSKNRMKKLSDIVELANFFFTDELQYDKKLLTWQKMGEGEVKESLETSSKILSDIKSWNIESLEKALMDGATAFNKEKGYPEKNRGYLLWPLRAALSGKENSPSPFEIGEILGKEKTLQRLEQAIAKL